jgi:Flp pilus assembly protein TadG
MAVVLPLLLLILFGIIDFGMLLNRQILLTEAAHEGARAAAFGQSDVAAKAANVLGTAPSSVTVTACPANAGPSADATVVLTYRYQAMTPLGSMMLLFGQSAPDTFELEARGVMACVG